MKAVCKTQTRILFAGAILVAFMLCACRNASGGDDDYYPERGTTDTTKTDDESKAKPNIPSEEPQTVVIPNFVKVEGNSTVATFWMSTHEVTQAEWEKIITDEDTEGVSKKPSYFDSSSNTKDVMGFSPKRDVADGETQKNRPVESVTWFDAVYYCNLLTEAEYGKKEAVYNIRNKQVDNEGHIVSATVTLVDGWRQKKGYRLPTVAEWKYVAEKGEKNAEDYGTNLDKYAWYGGNANFMTREVEKKAPLQGIYDMSGNVDEWCWPGDKTTVDKATTGIQYLGGNFILGADYVGSKYAGYGTVPMSYFMTLGFRVCSSFAPNN